MQQLVQQMAVTGAVPLAGAGRVGAAGAGRVGAGVRPGVQRTGAGARVGTDGGNRRVHRHHTEHDRDDEQHALPPPGIPVHDSTVAETGTAAPDPTVGRTDRAERPTVTGAAPVAGARLVTVAGVSGDLDIEVHRAHLIGTGYRLTGSRSDAEDAVQRADTPALVSLLHPDVALVSDGGGLVQAARRVIHGSDKVARFLVGLATRNGTDWLTSAVPVLVNGELGYWTPGLGGAAESVTVFSVADGRVAGGYTVLNPAKLDRVPGRPRPR